MTDENTCRCGRIKVGGYVDGSLNWNPNCPVHPWTEAMQATVDRSVELQRRAAEARRRSEDSDG
jgi:hypothetical protein